jgi:hypothetical protein
MNDKTQPLPAFTADFRSMQFPADYVGGSRIRHPLTTESQAVTQLLPVVR